MPETYRDTDNPLRAINDAMVYNSRDWAIDGCEAWLYGIVCGWSDEDEDGDGRTAMDEVATQVGWDAHDVARLKRLHANWQRIAGAIAVGEVDERQRAARRKAVTPDA